MDETDFISPVGFLTPDLFPGRDLTTLVTAWLADAVSKASAAATLEQLNEAVKSWVYYRAYFDVWQRLSSNPSSLSLDGTSMSMWQEQIASYLNLWKSYQGQYNDAMGLAKGKPVVSKAVKAVAAW